MAKSKKQIDESVACDLGLVLSPHTRTIREVAEAGNATVCLIFAFECDDYVCYDLVPVWREVNGMRIKLPKFQSHPTVVERLRKLLYRRYYTTDGRYLYPLKVKSVDEFNRRLPFEVGNITDCLTTLIEPDLVMGLRSKSLLFHRRKIQYE
jgi:hypothetical protein